MLISHAQQSDSSVQLLSHVRLFLGPRNTARQASITNSQSLLKLMSINLMMPSNQLILCHPLLLLPSISPSIRVFSNESVLRTRWPEYWSFIFSISLPMNIQDWFPLGLTGLISLQVQGTLKSFLQHYNAKASILQQVGAKEIKKKSVAEETVSDGAEYSALII